VAFHYLDDTSLEAVRAAAVEAGFATEAMMADLVADLPRPFVAATMPSGGSALSRLRAFTGTLNRTRVLVTGEIPLHLWLKAAIFSAGGQEQELVFRRALELSSADGVAEPPGGPPGPTASPAEDLDALPRTDGGLEVQIGNENDTLAVAFLHAGAAVSRSVARVMVHRHFDGRPSMLAGDKPDRGDGTGWLIAPRLLITNHHVVNARGPFEPPATEADFARQGAATELVFDFFAPDSTTTSTSSVGCLAADKDLDFALLRLPDTAPDRPPLPLRSNAVLKPRDRALKERINVLQHPNGESMRLGFRNNFVVTGTEDRLSYLTDTDGGASGSPLCDDAWVVAGLHRGFSAIKDGPVKVWGQDVKQENFGTPIPRIMMHLQQHHPDLHAEIVAAQI